MLSSAGVAEVFFATAAFFGLRLEALGGADELAFELTPAPPKTSKRKPKKAAVAKKTSATPAEESKGDEQD